MKPEQQPTATLRPAAIDGNRAYRYLRQICDIGPHPAGTEANNKVRKLVADHFQANGAVLHDHAFQGKDPKTGRLLNLVNLIGSWHPEKADRLMVCAHYDTRPHADEETDPTEYRKPFIGANDPGSGIALLMELANHLKTLETDRGIDLVLLDAEELVYGKNGGSDNYFLGSKAFARAYSQGRRQGRIKYKYEGAILLDMVGGKNIRIEREPYSLEVQPGLVEEVWSIAERLNETCFVRDLGREVYDDHWALNEGGIPTIDLIDFDYPHWHRVTDLPEHLSAASLASVGRVVSAWLALPRQPPRDGGAAAATRANGPRD